MGDILWFLGQKYDWQTDHNGKFSCHVSQQAFMEGLLHKFNLDHIVTAKRPYQLESKINQIKRDRVDPFNKTKLVDDYQLLFGGGVNLLLC